MRGMEEQQRMSQGDYALDIRIGQRLACNLNVIAEDRGYRSVAGVGQRFFEQPADLVMKLDCPKPAADF